MKRLLTAQEFKTSRANKKKLSSPTHPQTNEHTYPLLQKMPMQCRVTSLLNNCFVADEQLLRRMVKHEEQERTENLNYLRRFFF